MTAKQTISMLLIFTWLVPACPASQKRPPIPKNARLTWGELSPIVVDRKAKVTLSDGTKVQGLALAVRPDTLVLDITKTSDKHNWPKGQNAIPRSAVAELRLVKDSGPGKLIGGILGTIGGFMTAGVIAYAAEASAAAIPAMIAVIPAMAVGGYYLGKAADVRTRKITIVADREAVAAAEQGGSDATAND